MPKQKHKKLKSVLATITKVGTREKRANAGSCKVNDFKIISLTLDN